MVLMTCCVTCYDGLNIHQLVLYIWLVTSKRCGIKITPLISHVKCIKLLLERTKECAMLISMGGYYWIINLKWILIF